MHSALIGYSGFVGSNLKAQNAFSELYDFENRDGMRNKSFDLVVCAGAPGEKWRANQEPEKDWANIQSLIQNLKTITAKAFYLISTFDVYPVLRDVTEKTPIDEMASHAYGAHRFMLERFAAEHFPQCHIVRFPGLFGDGLKKNVIFDLLHDNLFEKINPESVFQYYDLKNIWKDISVVAKKNIPLINLATEPIQTKEIIQEFFPNAMVGKDPLPPVLYDVKTEYAGCFGKTGPYVYAKQEILECLAVFIKKQQQK